MYLDSVWAGRGRTAQRLWISFSVFNLHDPSRIPSQSFQGQILSSTWLGPAEPHHWGADSSLDSSPLSLPPHLKGHSHFFTQIIHVHGWKMSSSLFIERQHSTSPVLSRQGKGFRPRSAKQWEPGPTITLLGPAPSSLSGAWVARSDLFKLLFTVAYTEGLGLDTSSARGHGEKGWDEPFRRGSVLGLNNIFTTTKYSFPTFQCVTNCHCLPVLLGFSSSEILTWGGAKCWQESAFWTGTPDDSDTGTSRNFGEHLPISFKISFIIIFQIIEDYYSVKINSPSQTFHF